jgi:hypothetical protein
VKLDRDLAVLRRQDDRIVGVLSGPSGGSGGSGEKRKRECGASAASEHERTL